MNYDFSQLNDKEFEFIRIERFKPGRDQGVDGRYFSDDRGETVIQCKHYLKTGYKGLIYNLKSSEKPKVIKLKPRKYFVVTSLPLSRNNKKEIKTIFSPFIRIDPDQELIGLGTANVGSALSGGFPVTGGLSRSVVNFDAGAETPAAGGYTAIGIALTTMFLTPLLFFLPKAVLGAIIIAAVLSLVDVGALKRTFVYSKADFAAMSATMLVTWIKGIEAGLIIGVALSICLHLYRTSRPHIAVVGQIPGTGDFRNVKRHSVVVDPAVLSLRVDESLYFPNARFIEDAINAGVAANPDIRHVILECAAVNHIDISALESLESINKRLSDGGITFHLSEVKGPVMDRLRRSHLPEELAGKIHLTQYDAVSSINPELARQTLDSKGWGQSQVPES